MHYQWILRLTLYLNNKNMCFSSLSNFVSKLFWVHDMLENKQFFLDNKNPVLTVHKLVQCTVGYACTAQNGNFEIRQIYIFKYFFSWSWLRVFKFEVRKVRSQLFSVYNILLSKFSFTNAPKIYQCTWNTVSEMRHIVSHTRHLTSGIKFNSLNLKYQTFVL